MYIPVYAKHKLSNNMSFVKNNLTAISVEKKSYKFIKQKLFETANHYDSFACSTRVQIIMCQFLCPWRNESLT